MRAFRFAPFFVVLGILACSRTAPPATSPLPPQGFAADRSVLVSQKIKHIVFVVQENRTMDNIFGGPQRFPGADVVSAGQTSDGKTVALDKRELECIDLLHCSQEDPDNYHANWLLACNAPPGSGPPFTVGQPSPCRMNGFDKDQNSGKFVPGLIYSYTDYAQTKPYWDIAKAYALGDHFFMSHNSESYTAHQYIFSGQSNNTVDAPNFTSGLTFGFLTPWGCDSPSGTTTFYLDPVTGQESPHPTGPFPCFNYRSLADLVNAAHLRWRLYAFSICENINALDVNRSIRYSNLWPAFDEALCPIPLPIDTANFRAPETTFLSDVARGRLADVTWILPGPFTSDHPGVPFGSCGPWWVSKVVDAIGRSKFWDSTAVFVFWDDWGGFYDHTPPYVVRDQAGPGFRVPLLVVSPYAKRGYVAHSNAEPGTLLKFTETAFGLGSLGTTDASPYVGNMDDFFDFSSAQPFVNIAQPANACSHAPAQRDASGSRWLHMIDDD